MTREEKEIIIKQLTSEGKTLAQIGLVVKSHAKTVGRFLRKCGLNFTGQLFTEDRLCKRDSCNIVFAVQKSDRRMYCSRSCGAITNNQKRFGSSPQTSTQIRNAGYKLKYPELKGAQLIKKFKEDELLQEDFNQLSFGRIRSRIILEQNGECNKCKISEWFGKKITLEIDHIDGDHLNNKRSNVEGLCPNCHSITDTWRGKNRKDKKDNKGVTDIEFVKAFQENNSNVRQALLALKLTAKGGNYKRMYNFLDLHNIEYIKQSKRA